MTAQAIGSAGELIVQAGLLRRGWIAGNVNSGGMRNAPAIDIVAMKEKRNVRIAVKSCGPNACSQWSMSPGWSTLFKDDERPDFVAFVWFVDDNDPDKCRIFIVPSNVVDRAVRRAHTFWHEARGSDPDESKHVAIWWLGRDHDRCISREFARKWKRHENWDVLYNG